MKPTNNTQSKYRRAVVGYLAEKLSQKTLAGTETLKRTCVGWSKLVKVPGSVPAN